jgi:xylan 1,4-beta-xylosidase
MGAPPNLTREQANALAQKNSGAPITTRRIRVGAEQTFARNLPLRENDVYLLTLSR